MRRLVRGWLAPSDPTLEVEVFGKRLDGPLGLAAGFDKDAVGHEALHALGFAFIEVGTLTGEPQPGNPRPRLFRLVKDRALINRLGFNNGGSAAAAPRLASARRSPVGVNIGKTKLVTEDRASLDYVKSAELYASLQPDLMLMGHSLPQELTPERIDRMLVESRRLSELHRELLPLDDVDLGASGFAARIEPYRSLAGRGEAHALEVRVRNPLDHPETVAVSLVAPGGWDLTPATQTTLLDAGDEAVLAFRITASGPALRRARVAADVTVGGLRLGQQAEALVDVV